MAELPPDPLTLADFLKELSDDELWTFKALLKQEAPVFEAQPVPWPQIKRASRVELARELEELYPGQRAWEVMLTLFLLMQRQDIWVKVQRQRSKNKLTTYKEYMKEKFRLLWDTETCLPVPEHFYRETIKNEYLTLKNVLAHEPGPLTVVIRSVGGAGRTTFLRKVMLEWASGNLDGFTFVFFFCVYEMNSLAETSLLELISMDWPECSQMADEIFSQPHKILFIMEGFEELKFDLEVRTNLCTDWSQRQPTPIILSSLLQRELVPYCNLLLELGKTSVPRFYFLLKYPRDIHLKGFTEELIELYFLYFFRDRERAARAYHFVKENPQLHEMCSSPQMCWMVCSSVKWRLSRKEDLGVYVDTDTAAYACFLKDLFRAKCERWPFKQNRARVKSLCALAAEGRWTQMLLFGSEDLRRHGISDSDALLWLDTELLKPRGDRFVFYNFRLQSFCAALFYYLQKPTENPNPAIGNVTQLLTAAWVHGQAHLHQTASFIVGLTREKVIRMLEPPFGSLLLKEVREEIIRCLKSQQENMNAECFRDVFDSLLANQEERFLAQVVNLFEEMSISICNVDELTTCSNCLKHTQYLKKLRLHIEKIFSSGSEEDKVKKVWKDFCSLFRNNKNLKTLELDHCSFSEKSFTVLCNELPRPECQLGSLRCNFMSNFGIGSSFFNITLQSSHLKYLNLYGTDLYQARIESLCMALRHPSCCVEELMLAKCDISSEDCGNLASVLIYKKLKHLSLVDNPLKNEGVVLLCEALRHPNCALKTLMLSYCGLTSIICHYICQALAQNGSLTVLDLGSNFLQDNGVAYLCETLKQSGSTLKELWLPGCCFTQMCCKSICFFICNGKLKTLKLGNNEIRDIGVQCLCEALKHPRCRLEKLGLDMCQLTTDCCVALASALPACKTLRSLNLGWIRADHEGLMVLCEAVSREDCALQMLGLDKSAFGEDSQLLLQATEERKPCLTICHNPWIEEECRMKGVPLLEST